jgi:hypothetical protein
MGIRRHSEADTQRRFFTIIRRLGTIDPRMGLVYSVPNDGPLTESRRLYCFRMGMTRGISDVNVDIPSGDGKYGYLRLEFKSDTGCQSPDQHTFQSLVSQYGRGKYVICRTVSEAITAIADHLGESRDFWQMLQKKYSPREQRKKPIPPLDDIWKEFL